MRIILLLIIITLSIASSAQKSDPEFREFGKVSERDFQHSYLDDLGYDAVVLQNEKRMYFDIYNEQLRLYNVFHIRLKALKDGFKDDDIFTVKYSGRFNYEYVHMARCWIFTQHGSQINHKKLKYKNFKYYDRDSMESRMTVMLPEIHAGDIIDFEYTLITFDFILPPIWKSNCKYPCAASRLITNFPEFMQYKYDCKGAFADDIKHGSGDEFISIIYHFTPQDNPNSMYYMTGPMRRASIVYKFMGRIDTFSVARTMPTDMYEDHQVSQLYGTAAVRMRAAKFTQNIGYSGIYYTAWQQLTHLLYSYADPDNRELSQSEAWHKPYNPGYVLVASNSWSRLFKQQRKNPQFWKAMVKSITLPDELKPLTDPDEPLDTLAAAEKVYNYVINNITWDSTFDNHTTRSIENIIQSKRGNSAEINMTLVALMRRVGVSGISAMTCTSDFGEIDTAYANTAQFNTVLACLPYEERLILMDATDPKKQFGKVTPGRYDRIMWFMSPFKYFFGDAEYTDDKNYQLKKITEDM